MATIGERYGPAMEVTSQAAADSYFQFLVREMMMEFGKGQDEAKEIVRTNLGYYAGYYDNETRERVERLFGCAHPFFGKLSEKGPPTQEEAFRMGMEAGRRIKEGKPTIRKREKKSRIFDLE